MGSTAAPTPILVVIAGPQASGKSTLAAALADALRCEGERVALVEFDAIAAMALPSLPDWTAAREVFEIVVSRWFCADMSCVVAEGSGTAEEVVRLRRQAPHGAAVLTVALDVPFTVAFDRALADPSRGRSRERGFLSRVYERWPDELRAVAPDLCVRTDRTGLEECVDRVRGAIRDARRRSDDRGRA